MKTILFLLDRYPGYGGIETVTTCLASALANRYRIILCALKHEHEEALLPLLDSRIIYRALPHPISGYDNDNLAAFHAILNEEKVEMVIYQDSYAPNDYLPLSIRKSSGVHIIIAEHSSPSYSRRWLRLKLSECRPWELLRIAKCIYYGGRGVLRSLRRRTALYKHCDKYILLAQSLRQEFIQNSYIRDTDKLASISNPVSYTPQHIDLQKKRKQVLFIGQFVYDKGLGYLLRIWEKVAPQAPDWSLILVGDGPIMPETKEYIARRKVQRVHVEGFRSNIKDYCRDASILCMCSSFEGFPMVLPEAMSSGAVPMSFDSFAAIDDIFTDNISGCKIPSFDEEIYATRLSELMRNDEQRIRMAKEAMKQAERFRPEHLIARWEEIIGQLLTNEQE